MKIIKFLLWWWGKRDTPERVATVFISLIVSIVPMCLIFGVKGLLIVLATLLTLLIAGLLWAFVLAVKNQWDTYNIEKEQEAQRIIDRLSGNSRW